MPEFSRPYLYEKQREAFFTPLRYSFIEASTKAGKAQPLDATVYTPFGKNRMGNIKPGDFVLAVDGTPTKVLEIYPQGIRQCYVVEFSDGTLVECDGEHMWEIHNSRYAPTVVTTLELLRMPEWKRKRSYVPQIEAVDFVSRDVPVDPYLLGFLIGDGNLTNNVVRFSTADSQIVDLLQTKIPQDHKIRYIERVDYHITAGDNANYIKANGLHIINHLDSLGLMGKHAHEKSIPVNYIYNSQETRIRVLQGLMDADGWVNKHGQPMLEQSSWQLAEDVIELVQSLGGSVLTNSDNSAGYWNSDDIWIQGRTRYRQVIRLPNPEICFLLERKRNLVRTSSKSGGRMIKDVRPSRNVECQCIEVDHPRHLYLTEGFIPTHNTVAAIAWLLEQAFAGKPGQNFWWVAPVADQARIAFSRIKGGLTRGSFTSAESPTPKITLMNGAIIWFKSGDNPDSLYGEDVYAAVVDEASRVKEESWNALRSTLTATRGPVRVIGNVKGRKNWFYRLARMAESERDDPNSNMFYVKITVLDAIAAGVISQDEMEDARKVLPENVFRELYMAEPSDDTGNPFGLGHIAACTLRNPDGTLSKSIQSNQPPVAFGIDLAKKQDYFVVIGLDADGRVCVFQRWQGVPWRESIRRVHEIVGEDVPALVDSTGLGDPVLEELQVEHGNFAGYTFSAASKQRLMEGLAVSIQGHEISFPDGPIRSELEAFEYEYTRTGVRYSAPEGLHDDCVCALALAREQWTTSAPGQGLMDYYAGAAQRQIVEEPRDLELSAGELDIRRAPLPTPGEVLDNELTELYLKTLRGYQPQESTCHRCRKPIVGPSRVSDGVWVWHMECAG